MIILEIRGKWFQDEIIIKILQYNVYIDNTYKKLIIYEYNFRIICF